MPFDIVEDESPVTQGFVCIRSSHSGAICINPLTIVDTVEAFCNQTPETSDKCLMFGAGMGPGNPLEKVQLLKDHVLPNLPLFKAEDSVLQDEKCFSLRWALNESSQESNSEISAMKAFIGSVNSALDEKRNEETSPFLVCAKDSVNAQNALLETAKFFQF